MSSINNNNRFAELQNEDEDDNSDSEDNNNEQKSEPKLPPIFIPMVNNIKSMINTFSKIVSLDDFNYKSMSDGQIRIMPKNVETYRNLVKYLNEKNLFFHTYQLKEERSFRVVIKKLHYSTPLAEIKTCIEKLGLKVRNIINVRYRYTKQPLSVFYVDLDPNYDNKKIYDMRYLNSAVVSIEPPRKCNDLIQCHRCQEFGHTRSYCKKPPRCVKCGLGHLTIDCQKDENVPPRCVHCLQDHTANYKGCRVYKHIQNRRSQNSGTPVLNRNQTPYNNLHQHHFSSYVNSPNNLSYADALRHSEPHTNSSSLAKIEILLNKQIELSNNLLNMMTLLISKLCK